MKSGLARLNEICATLHVIQGDVEQHLAEMNYVQAGLSELGHAASLGIAMAVWTH
jgi:hypothetical protein